MMTSAYPAWDPWNYRESGYTSGREANWTGFDVEATDGSIGSIDEATYDTDASYIVVDTGPWIFGKKVLLPAGVVNNVDADARKVFVERTKEQIKNAPEYDEDTRDKPEYREDLGSYYGGFYGPGTV
jgi:hypothetical protein